MTPAIQALFEPERWIEHDAMLGHIIVAHPNGVQLCLTRVGVHWIVADHPARLCELARFHIMARTVDFQGAQADMVRVAGQKARASIEHLRLELAVWALSLHPDARTLAVERVSGTAWIVPQKTSVLVPAPLRAMLHDSRHALAWDPVSEGIDHTDYIRIALPESAHGAMALRASLHTP